MANESLSVLTKRLEADISLILRKIQLHKLGAKERESLAKLRQALVDAKTYCTAMSFRKHVTNSCKTPRLEKSGWGKPANRFSKPVNPMFLEPLTSLICRPKSTKSSED